MASAVETSLQQTITCHSEAVSQDFRCPYCSALTIAYGRHIATVPAEQAQTTAEPGIGITELRVSGL